MPDEQTPRPPQAFAAQAATEQAATRQNAVKPDTAGQAPSGTTSRTPPQAAREAGACSAQAGGTDVGPAGRHTDVTHDSAGQAATSQAAAAPAGRTGQSGGTTKLPLQVIPRIHPSVPTRLPAAVSPSPATAPTGSAAGSSPITRPYPLAANGGTTPGPQAGNADTAEPWLVWEALLAAVQRWTVQPAEALRHAHGITVYDYRLLRLLARAPRPMRKAIANTALDLPPRSLDHSVTRLSERGYLVVQGTRAARRLALTPSGAEFLIEVVETLRAVTTAGLTDTALRPTERAVLVALLGRLRT
ncbi:MULTISPECIES: MarR family winged helix-turn-helix transcriptional regulator [Actinoalloteichus]|uniref:Uncharacterized protein n=1 Tax=Actinoalloteichus fjordicus TaxID=1612552 RepID=A0AAC9LBZ7_9PSEU|nr:MULTISPECIES: MarR family winged helix-turn-helix transcriptional regulator [Actinoalloteichus]APU14802.1 hypothetical protein UA74_13720 [Actinoalloteichus fjordicus]APU20773.1 hypothetical protein UA75_13815 [Actinoalloteichus sp. GBA129-24]